MTPNPFKSFLPRRFCLLRRLVALAAVLLPLPRRHGSRGRDRRSLHPSTRHRATARVLVLDGPQRHGGGHHPRPGGIEGGGFRRRDDVQPERHRHAVAGQHRQQPAAGDHPLRQRRLVEAPPPRGVRGAPSRAHHRLPQLPGLRIQRRPVDHARALDAGNRLLGDARQRTRQRDGDAAPPEGQSPQPGVPGLQRGQRQVGKPRNPRAQHVLRGHRRARAARRGGGAEGPRARPFGEPVGRRPVALEPAGGQVDRLPFRPHDDGHAHPARPVESHRPGVRQDESRGHHAAHELRPRTSEEVLRRRDRQRTGTGIRLVRQLRGGHAQLDAPDARGVPRAARLRPDAFPAEVRQTGRRQRRGDEKVFRRFRPDDQGSVSRRGFRPEREAGARGGNANPQRTLRRPVGRQRGHPEVRSGGRGVLDLRRQILPVLP